MRHSATINEKQSKGLTLHRLDRHPAKPTLGSRQSDFVGNPNHNPRILCFFLRKRPQFAATRSDVFGLTFLHAVYSCSSYDEAREPLTAKRRAALYLRVSSNGQDTGAQETALREYVSRCNWAVHGVYKDLAVSGAQSSRPALNKLLQDCRRRKFDVLLVWRFDRFARSLKTLISGLEVCRAFGIDFVSVTEAVDTSLPAGELLFHLISAVSQFERSLIIERVRAGLEHARKNGRVLGRPPIRKLSKKEIAQLRAERAQRKLPFRKLAEKFGVSVWTAHQLCHRRKLHLTVSRLPRAKNKQE